MEEETNAHESMLKVDVRIGSGGWLKSRKPFIFFELSTIDNINQILDYAVEDSITPLVYTLVYNQTELFVWGINSANRLCIYFGYVWIGSGSVWLSLEWLICPCLVEIIQVWKSNLIN